MNGDTNRAPTIFDADPHFCRAATRNGALCREYRGLRFCLYCGSYRCWRHVCAHLRELRTQKGTKP